MRSNLFTVALLLLSSSSTLAHPQYISEGELIARDDIEQREANWNNDASLEEREYAEVEERDLFKRKGGGGGGKGGGSSSSGGSSSAGKGGSSSSSSSGSSAGRGSSSSSVGGSTKTGSGPARGYGGGSYYGGGASVPYAAGRSSPLGIAPVFLAASALAILPGLWLYGAYSYPYHHPYTFRNHSANATNTTNAEVLSRQTDTGFNQTRNVTCLCAAYAECGCDDSGNTTVLNELIGDGTYANLNKSLVNVAEVNGTTMIVLNGTLPNGTSAPGGTENASAAMKTVLEASGYWVMVALVMATCFAV